MKTPFTALGLILILGIASPLVAEEGSRLHLGASGAQWSVASGMGASVLTVAGPEGHERIEFPAGTDPRISLFTSAGSVRTDGLYRWELVVAPAVAADRNRGEEPAEKTGFVQSGTFAILGGAFDLGDAVESKLEKAPQAAGQDGPAPNDQVIADDLIVDGSACIGFDCANGEAFGFDTVRLKENNTRIKFEDTSTGGFPSTDWQLTANDSASGGLNKFSIEDITASRVPFTIEGSSPTNSVYVDASGRVGFGTSNPVLELHVSEGDSPGLRLEQNSSSGFAAQSWDVVGNETNFFVRDVSNGSLLPFRIRPGAPTSSLDINGTGKVGIGTASPSQKLHVRGSDGTTQYLVEETSATVANRVLMSLKNNGPVSTELTNTNSNGVTWRINNLVGGLAFNNINSPAADNEAIISPTGDLTILGSLSQGSDRNRKSNITGVDGMDVLAKLRRLPVATWSWQDQEDVRHLGPMAQDFKAIFDLGESDKAIAPLDVAGVSLAAIQALSQELDAKKSEIETLKSQNEALAARLAAIEAAVAKLADGQP